MKSLAVFYCIEQSGVFFGHSPKTWITDLKINLGAYFSEAKVSGSSCTRTASCEND